MIPSLPTYAGWWKQPERVSRNSETKQRFTRSNLFCLCFEAQLLNILSVIYKLVQSDSFATKRSPPPDISKSNKWRSESVWLSSGCACCSHRDIYYNNTQLFGSQKSVDAMVDDISCLLKVPRRALHVVGAFAVPEQTHFNPS